jgi:hypothetical protein
VVIARAAVALLVLAGSARGAIVGDGVTVQTVTLPAPPARGAAQVESSAGTVKQVRKLGPGRIAVDWIPPRLGAPMMVTFSAGAKTLGGVEVVPVPRPPRAVASNGPFALTGPDQLTLGVDQTAEISLRAPGAAPTVRVSAGRLGPLRRGGDGAWHASYTPPTQRAPQVAIFAAVGGPGDDGPLDVLAVPLYGQAQLDTTTEPYARVEVRIGDVTWGPVRADAHGRMRLTVIAAPGVSSGVTVAGDRAGNVHEQPLDLHVPPAGRLLGWCRGDRVELIAVDEHGRPSEAERFVLRASVGTLSTPRLVRPGVFEATLTAGDDEVGTQAQVSASIAEHAESQATCNLPLTTEWPNQVRLTVEPATFVAGEQPIAVTAELGYSGRRAPREVAVELSADLGRVGELTRVSPRLFRASWVLPGPLDGRTAATLRAHTAAGPRREATASIALRAGPAVRLAVSTSRARLPADGRSRATVAVTAVDAFGNPLSAERLSSSARGQVSIMGGTDGQRIEYTAPRDYVSYRDVITLRDESSRAAGTVTMRLVPLRHRFAVGARLGYLTNFGKISGPLVAASVELRPPWLRSALAFAVEVGFYDSSTRQRADSGEPVTLLVQGVPLAAQLKYQLPLGRFALYACGGGGALFPRVQVSAPSLGQTTTSSATWLAGGALGADVDVRYGRAAVEVGYWYAPLAGAVNGNAGGLAITAGYRFEFL